MFPALLSHVEQFDGCTLCLLHEGRNRMVFCRTSPVSPTSLPLADVLFVGEAPGAEEDAQGLPFVGRSGKALDTILEAVQPRLDLNCRLLEIPSKKWSYAITNTVCCRPPQNREPSVDETCACSPRLMDLISRLRPHLIVCVGEVAYRTLSSPLHLLGPKGIPLIKIFHPAYLLRQSKSKLVQEQLHAATEIAHSLALAFQNQNLYFPYK